MLPTIDIVLQDHYLQQVRVNTSRCVLPGPLTCLYRSYPPSRTWRACTSSSITTYTTSTPPQPLRRSSSAPYSSAQHSILATKNAANDDRCTFIDRSTHGHRKSPRRHCQVYHPLHPSCCRQMLGIHRDLQQITPLRR